MSAPGTVSVRFDALGAPAMVNQLKTVAGAMTGLQTNITNLKTATAAGGTGALFNNFNQSVTAVTQKTTGLKAQLTSIGSALSQQATSFGVATASVWGVYNAYDSLIKVQIRAEQASNRVRTTETTLTSLQQKRQAMLEKGNATAEQVALIDEKIANTKMKLSTQLEREADLAQDVQEAWAGFASTVGPQAIAAAGSITQLITGLTAKGADGVSVLGKLKNAFTQTIPSMLGFGKGSSIIQDSLKNLPIGLENTTSKSEGFGTAISKGSGALNTLAGVAIGLVGSAVIIEIGNQMQTVIDKFSNLDPKTRMSPLAAMFDQSGKGAKQWAVDVKEADIMAQAGVTGFDLFLDATGKSDIAMQKLIKGGYVDQYGKLIDKTGKSSKEAGGFVSDLGKDFKENSDQIAGHVANYMKMGKSQKEITAITKAWGLEGGNLNLVMYKANKIYSDYTATQEKGITIEEALSKAKGNTMTLSMIESSNYAKAGLKRNMVDALVQRGTLSLNEAQSLTIAQLDLIDKARQKDEGSMETLSQSTIGLTGDIANQVTAYLDNQIASVKYGEALNNVALKNRLVQQGTLAGVKATEEFVNGTIKSNAATDAQMASLANLVGGWDKLPPVVRTSVEAAQEYVKSQTGLNSVWDSAAMHLASMMDAVAGGAGTMFLMKQGTDEGVKSADEWAQSLVKNDAAQKATQKSLAMLVGGYDKLPPVVRTSVEATQEFVAWQLNMGKALDNASAHYDSMISVLEGGASTMFELDKGMQQGVTDADEWIKSIVESIGKNITFTSTLQDAAQVLNIDMTSALANTTEGLQFMIERALKVPAAVQQINDAVSKLAQSMMQQASTKKGAKELFKDLNLPDRVEKTIKLAFKVETNVEDIKSDIGQTAAGIQLAMQQGLKIPEQSLSKWAGEQLSRIQKAIKKHPALGATFAGIPEALQKIKDGDWKTGIDALATMIPGELDPQIKLAVASMQTMAAPIAAAIDKLTIMLEKMTGIHTEATSVATQLDKFGISKGWLSTVSPEGGARGFATAILGAGGEGDKDKPKEITPPKPVVFPMPDLSNITKGVALAEQDLGSVVDFVNNLTYSFTKPETGLIATGVAEAEVIVGSILDFINNLTYSFTKPETGLIATGVAEAEVIIGSVYGFITALELPFQQPTTTLISSGATEAMSILKQVQVYISKTLKLSFIQPDTVNISKGVTTAMSILKTVQTYISKTLTLPFQKPNTVNVSKGVTEGMSIAKQLQIYIAGLKLVFPKPNIDNVNSQVDAAQKKIDSLHGKEVTITTHYTSTGNPPHARGGIEFSDKATSSIWGEAGPELALFMPLRTPTSPAKGKFDLVIPQPNIDTRALRSAMSERVSSFAGVMRERAGPMIVHLTTINYLFPGAEEMKKTIRQYVIDETSRYNFA